MRKNIFILEPQTAKRKAPASFTCATTPTVTIWIHGTRFFYHQLYQQGIPYHEGLLCAEQGPLPYRLNNIASTLCKADSERFDRAHFYIFGWSGKLCFAEREAAAAHLYQELIQLIETYKTTHNCTPNIRIIAHSHGGNVGLNLALMQSEDNPVVIDELILLACPVQEKTKHLIEHPMFKKIYSLYSALDIVQIMDPQGMYNQRKKPDTFFSKRNFPHRTGLAQMKVKVDKRALTHLEFTRPGFLKLLPKVLTGIDLWHENITYMENPNEIQKLLCIYTKKSTTKTAAISV